jgi:hypothetical protein
MRGGGGGDTEAVNLLFTSNGKLEYVFAGFNGLHEEKRSRLLLLNLSSIADQRLPGYLCRTDHMAFFDIWQFRISGGEYHIHGGGGQQWKQQG